MQVRDHKGAGTKIHKCLVGFIIGLKLYSSYSEFTILGQSYIFNYYSKWKTIVVHTLYLWDQIILKKSNYAFILRNNVKENWYGITNDNIQKSNLQS